MKKQELDVAAERVVQKYEEFAIETGEVRGVRFNVFKNAPRNLTNLLALSVRQFGDLDLLVGGDERLSYRKFQARVDDLARVLQNTLGVRPGDRVAIAMRNRCEYPIAVMAVNAVGAAIVHLNAWWTSEELDYAITDCEAKVVFADTERAARLAKCRRFSELQVVTVGSNDGSDRSIEVLLSRVGRAPYSFVDASPDDDAAVIYTSGSTGHPKGVVLTHRNIITAVWCWKMVGPTRDQLEVREMTALNAAAEPRSANLVTVPFFHVSGMNSCFLLTMALGGKAVILDKWDPERAAELIERESITRFWGVPTMTADLLSLSERSRQRLATLKSLDAGGAKRPPEQVGRITAQHPGVEPSSGYGMTETSGLGLRVAGSDYVSEPDAAGFLLPPVQEMQIIGEDGAHVSPGHIGELVLKSPSVMRCYLNKPEATAEVLRDGWLRTGDLVRMDNKGMVFIVGRKKDIIIRGGENISSLEVEVAAHEHPAVLEACAFSIPDERLGETVGLAVQRARGMALDLDSLRSYLSSRLAQFKLPERLWVFELPLPRGATEKIDKRRVRQACLSPSSECASTNQ